MALLCISDKHIFDTSTLTLYHRDGDFAWSYSFIGEAIQIPLKTFLELSDRARRPGHLTLVFDDEQVESWFEWLLPEGRLFAILEVTPDGLSYTGELPDITINGLSVAHPDQINGGPEAAGKLMAFFTSPDAVQVSMLIRAHRQWYQRQQRLYLSAAGVL